MSEIYEPAEDSFLLQGVLKKHLPKLLKKDKNLRILEVGAGSGIQLTTILKFISNNNLFSCDINSEAVKHCKGLGFNCVKSDLFSKIKGKYNLIIFNPPYLPENKQEPKTSQVATTGGKKGSEIINRFLKHTKKHLNSNGKILLLTSSLTKNIDLGNWKRKLLDKKKLFFEELMVWEVWV